MASNSIDTPHKASTENQVNDRLAVIYFLWIGGATNIGWYAILNSIDFFNDKLLQDCAFIFPLSPYVSQLIATLMITQITNRFSYNTRIITSVTLLMIMTALVPLAAELFQETTFGMVLVMAFLFVVGFNNTVCYASAAGLTSQIGGKYTGSFLIGVALFGLTMNISKEITVLLIDPNERAVLSNFVYFGFAIALIVGSLILHGLFMKSEFYRVNVEEKVDEDSLSEDNETVLLKETNTPKKKQQPQREMKVLVEVGKQAKLYLILLVVICIQQYMLYPGVMLKKEIPGMEKHTKTVSMITTFSVFYIAGKRIGQIRKIYNTNTTIVVTLSRFIFMAMFIIQAVAKDILIISSPWFAYVNIAFFALTQGFLNVSLFILGPEQVKGDKKEVVGFLGVFALNIGSMIGAFSALLFKKL